MSMRFTLDANNREEKGSSHARRLRSQGKVPGVVYGPGQEDVSITLDEKNLMKNLSKQAFYSELIELNLHKKVMHVLLKAVQMHPFKRKVLSVDFMATKKNEAVVMEIPLHYVGVATAPSIKRGGRIAYHLKQVEVKCLPKDLPSSLEVDVSSLNIGDTLHLSDLNLPKNVSLTALLSGTTNNLPVVSIQKPKGKEESQQESASDADASS